MTTMLNEMNEEIVIPTFSFWQMFLMSAFDVDFTSDKFVVSKDTEVLALGIFIPKYSLLETLRMTFLLTDE